MGERSFKLPKKGPHVTERGLPKRTLVVALAGIGDLMFFLPALHALQELRASGSLDMLVFANGSASLIRAAQLADTVFEIPAASERKLWGRLETLNALRGLRLPQYDLAIWPFAFTTLKKRLLSRMINAQRFIMHEPLTRWARMPLGMREEWLPYASKRHVVQLNLDIIRALGLNAAVSAGPLIRFDAAEMSAGSEIVRTWRASAQNAPIVALHPGGNTVWSADRQWPIEQFAHLARSLYEKTNATIVWIGRPAERPLLEQGWSMAERGIVETSLPLTRLAAALSHVHAVVGNDSAIVHIAAAVGARTAVIHGPTDPALTGAWREGSFGVRASLPCSPCFDSGFSSRCPHQMCLTRLDAEWVAQEIVHWLSRGSTHLADPFISELWVDTDADPHYGSFLTQRLQWQTRRDRALARLRR